MTYFVYRNFYPTFVIQFNIKTMTKKVNSHKFFEDLWCAIPEEILSNKYIDENLEFMKTLAYSFFREYEKDTVSFDVSVRLVRKVMLNIFRNKPDLEDKYRNLN